MRVDARMAASLLRQPSSQAGTVSRLPGTPGADGTGLPAATEAEQTALGRLKQVREQRARDTSDLSELDKQAKAKRREALTAELQRLMALAKAMNGVMNPKAAAGQAARIAKQIAAVAKQLASLAERGSVSAIHAVAVSVPGVAKGQDQTSVADPAADVADMEAVRAEADDPAKEADDIAARGEGEARQAAEAAGTPASGTPPRKDGEARGPQDAAAEQEKEEERGRNASSGDGSTRTLLRDAADTIRLLKFIIRLAQEQDRAENGRAAILYGREQDDLEKEAAKVDAAAASMDSGIAASLSFGGVLDIRA